MWVVTVLGSCKYQLVFCVSNTLSLAYISIDHLLDDTHLLSIVNSTSSSSFPCKRKCIQSLQVDSPVKRNTLQEFLLFRGLYKSASPFCYCTCNRFNFLHVISAVLPVSHTSNVISIILADSYFRPCKPNVIHTAEPLGGCSSFCSHRFTPHCFTGHLQFPFPILSPQALSTPHSISIRLDFSGASKSTCLYPSPHPQPVQMGLVAQ